MATTKKIIILKIITKFLVKFLLKINPCTNNYFFQKDQVLLQLQKFPISILNDAEKFQVCYVFFFIKYNLTSLGKHNSIIQFIK